MRADLADVRLADQVFAPHYAAPMPRRISVATDLRAARERDAPVLATLEAGDLFEVLDLIGDAAWGIAPSASRVGYVSADALVRTDAGDAA